MSKRLITQPAAAAVLVAFRRTLPMLVKINPITTRWARIACSAVLVSAISLSVIADNSASGPSGPGAAALASEVATGGDEYDSKGNSSRTKEIPRSKTLVNPGHLRLVGGYRAPHFSGTTYGPVDSTGAARGGGTIHRIGDRYYGYCLNSEQRNHIEGTLSSQRIVEGYTSTPIGKGNDVQQWPMMKHARHWSRDDIFSDMVKQGELDDGTTIPNGCAYDPVTQRIYVSLYDIYKGASDHTPSQWVAAIDFESGRIDDDVRPSLPDIMGPFGGGLLIAPEGWAERHVGGRRLGLARGGLTGGQGGSSGPAIAFMPDTARGPTVPVEAMRFVNNATINADRLRHENDSCERTSPYEFRDHAERGLPLYESICGTVGWVYPVDPVSGEGYFATSSIRGNPAWVDHEQWKGVVWMVRSPTGELRYDKQNEGLSDGSASVMYVYDPDDFASAVAGEMLPGQIRGEFSRWDSQGVPGIPRSCTYDPSANLLWVFYTRSWERYGTRYPVWAAYELVRN